MAAALVVPRGRRRLLRYLVGCLLGLLGLQALLSLLSARCSVPLSLFHFDATAPSRAESAAVASTPRLLLAMSAAANSTAARVRADPLLVSVMTDKAAKRTAAPVNVTVAANASAGAVSTIRVPSWSATSGASAVQPQGSPGDLCPPVPLRLVGPLAVPRTAPPWEELERQEEFQRLRMGGRYSPPDCVARHRVAIIVPYRDREEHLRIFLYHMHPVLQRQQLDYGIFIVEQDGTEPFNRASLLNAGALEALKQHDFECFVFHDVDLLMEDDRNLYTCPQQPRHMSVAVDTMKYQLPYAQLVGGVAAINREQFQKVNGFSNQYWGWGGEDDDMYNRLAFHHLHIARYPANIARYTMVRHKQSKLNPKRFDLLRKGKKRFATDGLSSLQYDVKDLVLEKLYTRLLIGLKR